MTVPVPPRLIEKAARRFELESRKKGQAPPARGPRAITVSRQLGSGGRKIAEILETRLGWPVWDRQILAVIAGQCHLGYDVRTFESLDEKGQSSLETLAYSLLGDANKDLYLHLLPRAILTIAQNDVIILGRGAHLLLPEALKVRVVASPDTRVRNLVRFEGLSETKARTRIKASDRERRAFLLDLAARLGHPRPVGEGTEEYDLILNTDKFDIEEAASIILAVAERFFALGSRARSTARSREAAASGATTGAP